MFGERATSIYLVLSHCENTSELSAFDEWYDDHLKDMVQTGIFHRASRYELVTLGTCESHLAIYESMQTGLEIEKKIPNAVNNLQKLGKINPLVVVTTRLALEAMVPGLYRFTNGKLDAPSGLLLMANNPKTPGTDHAFNTWYDDVHRLDIKDTGMYENMNRFRAVSSEQIQYVNLYETKIPDVSRALTGLNDFRPKWQQAGTLYDDRVNTLRGAFQLKLSVSG